MAMFRERVGIVRGERRWERGSRLFNGREVIREDIREVNIIRSSQKADTFCFYGRLLWKAFMEGFYGRLL